MKKNTKTIIKTALAFGVIGAGFGVASLCLGFRPTDFVQALEDGRFELVHHGSHGILKFSTGFAEKNKITDFEETFADIDSLDLDIGIADCRIIPGDIEKCRVTGSHLPSEFTCEVEDGTLKLSCDDHQVYFFNIGTRLAKGTSELEIHVPAEHAFKEVKINAGIGELQIGDEFLVCDKMILDTGVGECEIHADIQQKLEVNGGVGEIRLNLAGCETDFNFDIDGGIGEMKIGDTEYSGFGIDKKLGNGAHKDVVIDHGIGEVKLQFHK